MYIYTPVVVGGVYGAEQNPVSNSHKGKVENDIPIIPDPKQ